MKRIPVMVLVLSAGLSAGCEGTLPTETEEYLALEASFEAAKTETDQLRTLNDTLGEQVNQVREDADERIVELEVDADERIAELEVDRNAEGQRARAAEREVQDLEVRLGAAERDAVFLEEEIALLRNPPIVVDERTLVAPDSWKSYRFNLSRGDILFVAMQATALSFDDFTDVVDMWLIKSQEEFEKFQRGETFLQFSNQGGRNMQRINYQFEIETTDRWFVVASGKGNERWAELDVEIAIVP